MEDLRYIRRQLNHDIKLPHVEVNQKFFGIVSKHTYRRVFTTGV